MSNAGWAPRGSKNGISIALAAAIAASGNMAACGVRFDGGKSALLHAGPSQTAGVLGANGYTSEVDGTADMSPADGFGLTFTAQPMAGLLTGPLGGERERPGRLRRGHRGGQGRRLRVRLRAGGLVERDSSGEVTRERPLSRARVLLGPTAEVRP
jgi:hypothetical protein